MNIEKQKKIALAIMEQDFKEHAGKEKHAQKIMGLAHKAGVPYKVAVTFVELSPKRDDVALAILQQSFLERSMGPEYMLRVHALAKKAGVSYPDARDFAEAIITTKLAEILAAASPVIETCT